MSFFDAKSFNPNVFLKYMGTVENPQTLAFIRAGLFVGKPELAQALKEGVGGNFMTENMSGRLNSKHSTNYDGNNNIGDQTLPTYTRGIVVIGRAEGFRERDFSYDITGKDFMSQVAEQVVEYWDGVHQLLLLTILKGIFGSALASKIIEKPLANLSVADVIDGIALNGDKGKNIVAVGMNSTIFYALQKANLLEMLKYTDKEGVIRDTGLYTWQGRIIIHDDDFEAEESYALTTDTAIVAGKVYYTKSGDVYTPVAEPDEDDLATYYEKTVKDPVYLLGAGCFTFQDVGVKVPVEMARDASTHGGEDVLYSRERIVLAPYGVGFKQSAMSSNSPTDAELATASAWELAKDGSNNAIALKTIPFACIKFVRTGI